MSLTVSMNPSMGPDGSADGSYSVSDEGCPGDQPPAYAISPRPYPVPGYLRMYENLRVALRESVDACALQMGPCWVLRADQVHQRCGQACHGGCPTPGPTALASVTGNRFPGPLYPDSVRREVQANWKPVMRVDSSGIALTPSPGCVLPIWQRIFYVGDEQNHFARDKPGLVYNAAVEAARYIARTQGKTRVVMGTDTSGRTVPVVYVDPGGIVRAMPRDAGPETVVVPMSEFELRQYMAASRGATLMPFGM